MPDSKKSPDRSIGSDPDGGHEDRIRWDHDSPLTSAIETREGDCRTRHGRFIGGAADGVEVVEIDTGAVRVIVLPGRGMSIWKAQAGGVRLGWDSPIAGPVHPTRVPLFDPSGLGWLEGFDELLVRCGLESNGAPEFDDAGHLRYPLHGRIGNLPAAGLQLEYDGSSGSVDLIGDVHESRLFFRRFRMRTRIRLHAGQPDIEIQDEVTNELSTTATMQMLYHINLGPPLLGADSILEAPIRELAPKDDRSATEIDHWTRFGPPQSGFAERVYFAELYADDDHRATAMLRSADAECGLAVQFDTQTLPRFIVWKNTAAETDGYVTGLEPATNFPNARSFEASQGRVVELGPGESVVFRVSLIPLLDAEAVRLMSTAIQNLRHGRPCTIHQEPRPDWTPG